MDDLPTFVATAQGSTTVSIEGTTDEAHLLIRNQCAEVSQTLVSSSACTRRAIAGTVFPPAEASTTIARRSRIGEPEPLRVILSSC
ncbi:hypothetical protein [Micromonospora sp. DT62]|uniref:hypothetical protein n=1 Tax=Micromonospora sp. DT62 TaxID=3416521 RepID=UPI003CEA48B9